MWFKKKKNVKKEVAINTITIVKNSATDYSSVIDWGANRKENGFDVHMTFLDGGKLFLTGVTEFRVGPDQWIEDKEVQS